MSLRQSPEAPDILMVVTLGQWTQLFCSNEARGEAAASEDEERTWPYPGKAKLPVVPLLSASGFIFKTVIFTEKALSMGNNRI